MPTTRTLCSACWAIVGVANGADVRTTALLTDMNQVLASSAGNAVEVREAVQFLTGEYQARLFDVTMALCVEMLISGNWRKTTLKRARSCRRCWITAKRQRSLAAWWRRKKGPTDFVEKLREIPADWRRSAKPFMLIAKVSLLWTPCTGIWWSQWVAGRRQASDTIDYSVGFTDMARLGDSVDGERPLAVIHAKRRNQLAGGGEGGGGYYAC